MENNVFVSGFGFHVSGLNDVLVFDYIPNVEYDNDDEPINLSVDKVVEFLHSIGEGNEDSLIRKINEHSGLIIINGIPFYYGLNGGWLDEITNHPNNGDCSIWTLETTFEYSLIEFYFSYNELVNAKRIGINKYVVGEKEDIIELLSCV